MVSFADYNEVRSQLTLLSHLFKVQYQVTAHFVSDTLRGDETTEMKVTLVRIMDEEVPAGDD